MTLLVAPKPSIHRHGVGELTFAHVEGKTAVTRAAATSPLRLLTPKNSGKAAWAFMSSYGGGLVAGDDIRIHIDIEQHATAYVSTQSSTKIYRMLGGVGCHQTLNANIADDALLVLTPDPVVCFADAHYTQSQLFLLAPTANLVLLDWFTSGRHARGERWQFDRLQSRNEIFVGKKRILIDALRLSGIDGPLTDPLRMGDFNCFATLVLLGNCLTPHTQSILHKISTIPTVRKQPLIVGASPLADGVIVRLAAERTEDAAWFFYEQLSFLAEMLGEHPWLRKW